MKRVWERWKKVALEIGNFQFKIIFSLLYFILIIPIGFFFSHLADPLNKRGRSRWTAIKDNTSTLGRMQRQ